MWALSCNFCQRKASGWASGGFSEGVGTWGGRLRAQAGWPVVLGLLWAACSGTTEEEDQPLAFWSQLAGETGPQTGECTTHRCGGREDPRLLLSSELVESGLRPFPAGAGAEAGTKGQAGGSHPGNGRDV